MKITISKLLQCLSILLKTSTIPKKDWFHLSKSIFLTLLNHPDSIFSRRTQESQKHFLTDYLQKPIIVKSPEGFFFVARPKYEDLARFLFSSIAAKWEPISLIPNKCGIVIDLGSNVGYYTIKLSLHDKNSKIIAIEADPKNFEILTKNCKLNNLDNVDLYNVAISDKNGQVELFQSDSRSGTSSIVSRIDKAKNSISVKSLTLDNLLENKYHKIDWLKIDVEGSELSVLKGASNTLKITNNIIIELHEKILKQNNQNPEQIISILEKNNYKITTFNEYWDSETSQNQNLKSDYILAKKIKT